MYGLYTNIKIHRNFILCNFLGRGGLYRYIIPLNLLYTYKKLDYNFILKNCSSLEDPLH